MTMKSTFVRTNIEHTLCSMFVENRKIKTTAIIIELRYLDLIMMHYPLLMIRSS